MITFNNFNNQRFHSSFNNFVLINNFLSSWLKFSFTVAPVPTIITASISFLRSGKRFLIDACSFLLIWFRITDFLETFLLIINPKRLFAKLFGIHFKTMSPSLVFFPLSNTFRKSPLFFSRLGFESTSLKKRQSPFG